MDAMVDEPGGGGAGLDGGEEALEVWRVWRGGIECLGTERAWTADDLRAAAAGAGHVLKDAGVAAGDGVAVALANTAAFPVLLMALLERRATPLLVFAGTREAELRRVVEEMHTAWVIHDFLPGVSQLVPGVYPVAAEISFGPVSVALLRTQRKTQDAGRLAGGCHTTVDVTCRSQSEEDGASPLLCGAILHPTSGTYGKSRYCVRNQRVAVAEARNYVESIACYDRIRVATTTPLSHAYAYGFGLMASLLTDSTLVLDPVFNPKRVLRREVERPSNILALVPPMARALARLAARETPPRLARHTFYAGAPCPRDVMEEFRGVFGAELYAIYGTTETGAISTSYDGSARLAGVGKPLRNVEVQVRHAEHYAALRQGAGEIAVRSTSMMQGYLHDGAVEAPGDAWPTQDIGYFDGTGALSLIGRVRDIINLGGMKVDPVQVESVLRGHPAVLDAAVYPGLHPDATEFVQAAVQVNNAGVDEVTLRAYCLEQLDAYKTPLRFHFVAEIPRTPSGKCLKIQCPEFPPSFILR
ncbi:MAG: acyl--CoA ligase [Candidatus Hydrogenedentes bacterium]|nr:acyl--CoA ligase [Candidatus Hydrogenedentota bacterium]